MVDALSPPLQLISQGKSLWLPWSHDPIVGSWPATKPTSNGSAPSSPRWASSPRQSGPALHHLWQPRLPLSGQSPALHGPYWQWCRAAAGKTVTRRVTHDQVPLDQSWIANRRRLRKIIAWIEEISDPGHPDPPPAALDRLPSHSTRGAKSLSLGPLTPLYPGKVTNAGTERHVDPIAPNIALDTIFGDEYRSA